MAFKLKSQKSVKSGGFKMMGSSPKKSALPLQPSLKTTYKEAFERMKPTKSGTRVDKFGNIYKNTKEGFEKFKAAAKDYNAKKNKGAGKTSAQPTKTVNIPKVDLSKAKPTIDKLVNTAKETLNKIQPTVKNETKVKLKKNKTTGRTKTKTVEKVGDKVIKTKTITDRQGNTKTKTKTRKRTGGKGKQKIAKALVKLAGRIVT